MSTPALGPLLAALGAAAQSGPGDGSPTTRMAVVVEVLDLDDDAALQVRQVVVRFEGESVPSDRPVIAPGGLTPNVTAGDRVVLLAVGKTFIVLAAMNADPSPPYGTVIISATPADPPGWIKCNGQTLSRDAWPRLFGALGTLYGAGDGTTTFVIPGMSHPVPGKLHYVIRAR